ncbi:MAG: glucose-6-phosphate isomerase, partial [Candidatus Parabeggiatoa sp. nov. 3]
YDYALALFPAYLQQLVMESLGKHVTREGNSVDYPTSDILWGAPGNNGQHAFYQLLHQGTHLVPADFLIAIESQYDLPGHQDAVLSNALAQTYALMMGRTTEETKQALFSKGISGDELLTQQLPHRVFEGNQPTNTLMYQKLTPKILGTLIALYEQKVFVQSVCWGINPFDQWGVELGKQVASTLLPALKADNVYDGHDSSTAGLLNYIKTYRS